jgi:hypothetical protein
MGRVDPGTVRVTAVTPLGGARHRGDDPWRWGLGACGSAGRYISARCPGSWWTGSTHPAAASAGSTLARATEGLLVADQDSLWFAALGGRRLLRLDPSRM